MGHPQDQGRPPRPSPMTSSEGLISGTSLWKGALAQEVNVCDALKQVREDGEVVPEAVTGGVIFKVLQMNLRNWHLRKVVGMFFR